LQQKPPKKDERDVPAQKQDSSKRIRGYAQYSGLAYQMIGLLAVTIYLGLKADAHFGNETQIITALSSLFVLVTFLYKVTRTFMK